MRSINMNIYFLDFISFGGSVWLDYNSAKVLFPDFFRETMCKVVVTGQYKEEIRETV